MNTIEILRQLAIIIIFAKLFGLIARKLHAPQVAGEIIAGLLIGPSILGWVKSSEFLSGMAEIGVIMLMFNAGLGTNIHELKKSGVKATLIACAGVFVPLVCGTFLFMSFYGYDKIGTEKFYKALYIGTILTATSVSITVQTLKELGKLSSFVGTTVTSAAIIDDVIGIIVLTVVIGFKDPSSKTSAVILQTLLFFVFASLAGFIFHKIFKVFAKRYDHTRRIPIVGLALAFSFAYIAQKFFNVADITGAYIAGVILCSTKESSYISRKMDINSYMLFGPIFFASIGLKTDLSGMTLEILFFAIAFVIVGCISKIIGCGGISKALGFSWKESYQIGLGMMVRGEVALIVATKGLSSGLIDSQYFTAVILLIITSSMLVPILLKKAFAEKINSQK